MYNIFNNLTDCYFETLIPPLSKDSAQSRAPHLKPKGIQEHQPKKTSDLIRNEIVEFPCTTQQEAFPAKERTQSPFLPSQSSSERVNDKNLKKDFMSGDFVTVKGYKQKVST